MEAAAFLTPPLHAMSHTVHLPGQKNNIEQYVQEVVHIAKELIDDWSYKDPIVSKIHSCLMETQIIMCYNLGESCCGK